MLTAKEIQYVSKFFKRRRSNSFCNVKYVRRHGDNALRVTRIFFLGSMNTYNRIERGIEQGETESEGFRLCPDINCSVKERYGEDIHGHLDELFAPTSALMELCWRFDTGDRKKVSGGTQDGVNGIPEWANIFMGMRVLEMICAEWYRALCHTRAIAIFTLTRKLTGQRRSTIDELGWNTYSRVQKSYSKLYNFAHIKNVEWKGMAANIGVHNN